MADSSSNVFTDSVDNKGVTSRRRVWQTLLTSMWFTLIIPYKLQFLGRPREL